MNGKIYIAESRYTYEGGNIEGVYTSKTEALNHHFDGGDEKIIHVYQPMKSGKTKYLGELDRLTKKVKK